MSVSFCLTGKDLGSYMGVFSHYLVIFVARSYEGQSEKPNVGPLGESDSPNRRPLMCPRWSMPVGQVHLS